MSCRKIHKLALALIAAWGSCLALTTPAFAVGYPVPVAAEDVWCDQNCKPCWCQRFCRTLKLHCVYFKRSCCQKYVRMPVGSECPPGFIPADCPTYHEASPYPTINGYGSPSIPAGPTGVFVR
ncbi:MAG: hypothetical protein JSS02_03220 [Planctomycetes bacterium]|nr:hypothetical protein [Planctomycetota bacterium]